MRNPEDILKTFENLDKVPGSKRVRRESSPVADQRRKRILDDETNGWDSNPVIKSLRGQEVEFFTINSLATALEKSVVSIRLWEKKGFIPKAPYRLRSKTLNGKKVEGNRAYTRDLIEVAIEEFSRRGLLGSARVEWKNHDDLTDALVKRWKDIVGN
jgi:hypothetical protein